MTDIYDYHYIAYTNEGGGHRLLDLYPISRYSPDESHNITLQQYTYTSALLKRPRQTEHLSVSPQGSPPVLARTPTTPRGCYATLIHLLWTMSMKHLSPPLWAIITYYICLIITLPPPPPQHERAQNKEQSDKLRPRT